MSDEISRRELAYAHRGEVVEGSGVPLAPLRMWSVRIPAPDEFINANHRRDRRQMAGRVANWRMAGLVYARKYHCPHLERARIRAELHFADSRRRDDHNYFGTIKALIDGIVGDYGALPDDSARYLLGVEICRGEPILPKMYGPCGAVTIHVTEVVA